jgi:hypothetical protein
MYTTCIQQQQQNVMDILFLSVIRRPVKLTLFPQMEFTVSKKESLAMTVAGHCTHKLIM